MVENGRKLAQWLLSVNMDIKRISYFVYKYSPSRKIFKSLSDVAYYICRASVFEYVTYTIIYKKFANRRCISI
jgi:hypothetical protein